MLTWQTHWYDARLSFAVTQLSGTGTRAKGNALEAHGLTRRQLLQQLNSTTYQHYPPEFKNCRWSKLPSPFQTSTFPCMVSCTCFPRASQGKPNVNESIIVFLWLTVGFLNVLCQKNICVEQLLDVRNIVVLSYIDTTSHSHQEGEAAPE